MSEESWFYSKKGQIWSVLYNIRPAGAYTGFNSMGAGWSFPGVKLPGFRLITPPPPLPSAEGKIEWSFDSTHPYAPEQVEFHSYDVHTNSDASLVFLLSVDLLWIFLGAFARLRKVTISFVMCVCLSDYPHGTTRLPLDGFLWNFFDYFSKVSRKKIQVSFISDKNNGYFTSRPAG